MTRPDPIAALDQALESIRAELAFARADNARLVEANQLQGERLESFRAAEDRPWFCRFCGVGRLLPFGLNGLRCDVESCGAKYSGEVVR